MLYLLSFNPTFEWSLNSVALALGAFFLLRTVAIRPVPSIHLRFCSSFGANLHLLWLPLRWGMSLSSVRWSDIDKKDSFNMFTMIYFKLTLFGTNDRTTGSANLLLLIENLNERNLTRCGNLETSPPTNEISPHRPGRGNAFEVSNLRLFPPVPTTLLLLFSAVPNRRIWRENG